MARPDGRIKRSPVDDRTYKGIVFASKREMNRFIELELLERGGKIKDIVLQPEFELQPAHVYQDRKRPPILYRADFRYWDCEKKRIIIEDVKGYATDVFKLKMRMFEYQFPELEVVLV